MRLIQVLSLLLGALLSAGVVSAEQSTMPLHERPQPLPPIAFTDESGRPLTLDDWRGKVVLLNVWATWCGPCRAEMPTLDRLQAELGGDRFEVVALSIDRAGVGVVRKFFDEIGIEHLRIFVDDTMKISRDLKIFGLPATLLIGPDGRELGRLIGPAEWDAPDMIAFFRTTITNDKQRK
jgi:thiol-disulfide isomerase/thioredoxin